MWLLRYNDGYLLPGKYSSLGSKVHHFYVILMSNWSHVCTNDQKITVNFWSLDVICTNMTSIWHQNDIKMTNFATWIWAFTNYYHFKDIISWVFILLQTAKWFLRRYMVITSLRHYILNNWHLKDLSILT